MARASEDITDNNSMVLVSKDQYYCQRCGLIKDDSADADTTNKKSLAKKREQVGPRITKRNNDVVFFKSITYPQIYPESKSTKPDFLKREEEYKEERLRSQGCIVGTRYDY